jgi:hypothetical protein
MNFCSESTELAPAPEEKNGARCASLRASGRVRTKRTKVRARAAGRGEKNLAFDFR